MKTSLFPKPTQDQTGDMWSINPDFLGKVQLIYDKISLDEPTVSLSQIEDVLLAAEIVLSLEKQTNQP